MSVTIHETQGKTSGDKEERNGVKTGEGSGDCELECWPSSGRVQGLVEVIERRMCDGGRRDRRSP